jgi:uncharacterized protein (TIGR02996 family)
VDADELALLAAVLASPGDDTPRLVYADWLDEHGNPERAEFIRMQCELAKRVRETGGFGVCEPGHGPSCQCTLRRRERELLVGRAWFFNGGILGTYTEGHGNNNAMIARRGFVESLVIDWRTFAGGECGRCEGRGWWQDMGPNTFQQTCMTCSGTGRTPGIAESLIWRADVACPKCDGAGGRMGAGCFFCSATGRVPNPDPPPLTAQPVREVVLTTWPVYEETFRPGEGHRIRFSGSDHWHDLRALWRAGSRWTRLGELLAIECPGVTFRLPG